MVGRGFPSKSCAGEGGLSVNGQPIGYRLIGRSLLAAWILQIEAVNKNLLFRLQNPGVRVIEILLKDAWDRQELIAVRREGLSTLQVAGVAEGVGGSAVSGRRSILVDLQGEGRPRIELVVRP